MDATESIGRRIANVRKLRGLTQQQLADRVPCSKSLIAQVEAGHKPATQALVAGVARTLAVDLNKLTGQPYHAEDRDRHMQDRVYASIPAVRRALLAWDLPDEDLPTRPFDALLADVRRASELGRTARYDQLGDMLPPLLEELATATHAAADEARPSLFGLLAEAYTGATAIAYALGYVDLRSLAMERVEWAARGSQDPLRVARTQWQRSTLFFATAAYDRGQRLLERVRRELGDNPGRMDSATLSMYGATHLRSAVFAARAGNRPAAWDHIAEAREVAGILDGDRNDYGLEFGPSNVHIHAVGVAVELSDGAEAIRLARGWKLPATVAPVRAGHYWMDLARGFLYAGDRERAFQALVTARKLAPQQIRLHPMVRETVRALIDLERRRSHGLASFSAWLGMR